MEQRYINCFRSSEMVFDILSDSLLKSRDHLKQCIRVGFEAEILSKKVGREHS